MPFNIKNRTPIVIGGLQIFSKNKMDASKCKDRFAIGSLQSRNKPQAILRDLTRIQSILEPSQSNQKATSEILEQKIVHVNKQIKILKPENILIKLIYFLFSRFFKTELDTIARLESEKRLLIQRNIRILTRMDKDAKTLDQVKAQIKSISSTQPKEKTHEKVYASAEAIIYAYNVNSVKRTLEQSLSPLVIQTTQKLVNKTFKQDPEKPKFQTKILEEEPDVSIKDNPDGSHVALLKFKQSVHGPLPSEKEVVRFDSLCKVRLDPQGHIQNVSLENIVDRWSIDSRTPLQILEKDYQIPMVDDSEHFQPQSLNVNGTIHPVKISKNFIGDCWRQIDNLKIQGMGSLAARHTHLRKEKDRIYAKYEKSLRGSDTNHSKHLGEQHEQVKKEYCNQILEDLLTIIYEKLGSRHALLPIVTHLFDPAAAGPLQILISAIKYWAFPYALDSGQGVNFTFTLDIPDDNEKPIRVMCNGQGKIDRFNVKATGTYTIHLDGHVEFEGEVT